MFISVQKIIALNHPMNQGCWLTGKVPTWMVHKRVRLNKGIDVPVMNDSSPWIHAGRIAHLVSHKWTDKIIIDVGVDDKFNDQWLIYDGNHRVAAAWFRGDNMIDVEYAGCTRLFNKLFNCFGNYVE